MSDPKPVPTLDPNWHLKLFGPSEADAKLGWRRLMEVAATETAQLCDQWSKCAFWTCEEAVALSMGADPRLLNATFRDHFTEDQLNQFFSLLPIVRRKFGQRAVPAEFLSWASTNDVSVPENLVMAVRSRHPKLKPIRPASETKRHSTLLQILLAMAIKRYGYPKDRSAMKNIVRDIEDCGLEISDSTVRDYLNQASADFPEALEPKKP